MKENARIILAALGNENRSDDGFGLKMIRWLKKQCGLPNDQIECVELGVSSAAAMTLATDCDWLIFIDAVKREQSGRQAMWLDPLLGEAGIGRQRIRPNADFNPHQPDLPSLLALLDCLQALPSRVSLLGVTMSNYTLNKEPDYVASYPLAECEKLFREQMSKEGIRLEGGSDA